MSARTRAAIDIGLFLALLAAFNPAWTGLAVHEWLSVAIIPPLLFHLILNWEWAVRVFSAFIDRLFHTTRVNLVVDAVLFVSSVAVMLSGLMVSQVVGRAIGFSGTPGALWAAVHAVTANTTIALLVAHFALHAKWFVRVLSMPGRAARRLSHSPTRAQG
jgi:hypothetical protein